MLKSGEEEESRGRKRGKAVRVARTSVGKGVFAQRTYRGGDIIGEIDGEVIDDVEYGSDYCMNMGDNRRLEPAPPFRYVNHSCEPNCRFDFFDVRDDSKPPSARRRVFLLAKYEIRPGEQFTIDYGWSWQGAIRCRCGAPTRRGWIVSVADLPQLLAHLALG